MHWLRKIEQSIKILLFLAAASVSTLTLLIILILLGEAYRFFTIVSPFEFLFGLTWSPQSEAVAVAYSTFGAVPLFTGTLLVTLVAMAVSIPLGIGSAVYLAEYTNKHLRSIIKPAVEILAGIPTVVYGYFAALTVAPIIRNMGDKLGLEVASESALAAGIVMGIMIIPFILSITDDVISSIPQTLRDAALALGSTKSEMIAKVILPSALPGIMSAILLAMSRAIGETMIVTMASGLNANLTMNPLASVTTVTAQIVSLLVGDQEFDSPKTLAAFALALTLFIITLLINIIALMIVKKYKERYD